MWSTLQKYNINCEILKSQVISLAVNWESGEITSSVGSTQKRLRFSGSFGGVLQLKCPVNFLDSNENWLQAHRTGFEGKSLAAQEPLNRRVLLSSLGD